MVGWSVCRLILTRLGEHDWMPKMDIRFHGIKKPFGMTHICVPDINVYVVGNREKISIKFRWASIFFFQKGPWKSPSLSLLLRILDFQRCSSLFTTTESFYTSSELFFPMPRRSPVNSFHRFWLRLFLIYPCSKLTLHQKNISSSKENRT